MNNNLQLKLTQQSRRLQETTFPPRPPPQGSGAGRKTLPWRCIEAPQIKCRKVGTALGPRKGARSADPAEKMSGLCL